MFKGVLLDYGGAGHGMGMTFGQTATNTRERAIDKQERGSNKNVLYNVCYITRCLSISTFALKIFEDLGQLDDGLAVARRQQQADCRYVRIGISKKRAFWLEKAGLEPRLFLCFLRWRWRGGVGGMRVKGSRLGGCGLGTGGGKETVRLDVYNSFSLGWYVAVGEQH